MATTDAGGEVEVRVVHEVFGRTPGGEAVEIWTLLGGGVEVRIMTLGARIVGIRTPDRAGAMADLALGYATLDGYFAGKNTYFGALVGRYANRIAGGRFQLDGVEYQVPLQKGAANSLHGGVVGFDMLVWSAREIEGGVEMSLVSPDGDQGFPGRLTVHVRYTLRGSALHIGIRAETEKATVVNLTNHTYFNLSGEGSGLITDEVVSINADRFVPVGGAGMIPTGELREVKGTPFDLRRPTRIGEGIDADDEQLKLAGGYDHCWVVNGQAGEMREAARVEDPGTGRTLAVLTTEPGVQFYTGNSLDGTNVGKTGRAYVRRSGFCLETEHFPDSPNHPNFPSTVLRPGEIRQSETVFSFGVKL